MLRIHALLFLSFALLLSQAIGAKYKLQKNNLQKKKGLKSQKKKGKKGGKTKDEKCPSPAQNPNHGLAEDLVNCMHNVDAVVESLQNLAAYLSRNKSTFSGNVAVDGDDEYEALKDQYASPNVVTMPSYIIQAINELDVQATVTFGAECGYKITARSGGHSYVGSSSCDGGETPCIQLDVGMIEHIQVSGTEAGGGKELHVGPGVTLESMAEVLVEENIFVPAGECNHIGVGGHLQTGGIGPWGPLFGFFSHYVNSFKIVLADGSLHSVNRPKSGETSQLNDDLFYAVLGGASGSYGVIVDVGLNTVKEDEYYSFYWEVNFLYDSTTTRPGIIKMLHKYADLLKDVDLQSTDTRWNIWWTLVGSKTALTVATKGFGFNYFQLDLVWAIPKSSVSSETDAFNEAQAFYDALVHECTDCVLLDSILPESLQPSFPSAYGVSDSMSRLYQDLTIFIWDSFPLDGVPFKSSYQQGPEFPDGDELEGIITRIDNLVPKTGDPATEPVFIISQLVTLPSQKFADSTIALPFQNDAFAVSLDMWDFSGGLLVNSFIEKLRGVQDFVISSLGGVDHRMFSFAYEDPCLDCGDWKKYYDSPEKYAELVEIKSCVDPNNLFQNRMSLPITVE